MLLVMVAMMRIGNTDLMYGLLRSLSMFGIFFLLLMGFWLFIVAMAVIYYCIACEERKQQQMDEDRWADHNERLRKTLGDERPEDERYIH